MTDFFSMTGADRLRVVTGQVRNALRAGATATLTGLALSDAGPVNGFNLDFPLAGGFFAGGCIVWALTTLAAPPRN